MPPTRNILVVVITRVALCAALVVVSGLIFAVLVWTKPEARLVAGGGGARRVEVMQVIAVPVRRQWSGFGTAHADDSADVAAEVAGVVVSVPVSIKAGAEVRRGDVLATLDAADFIERADIVDRQIAELEAQLEQLALEEASWSQRSELAVQETELARRELERVLGAAQRKAAQPREVDRARMELNVLERAETRTKEELAKIGPRRGQLQARRGALRAQLKLARRNVERCSVRSPLDGVVQAVDVQAGERVEVSRRVARVVDLARIEVPLRLPASARPYVAVGDEVRLVSQGSAQQSWAARVNRIGPEDDQRTRTMTVYVELAQDPQSRGLLVPGRFVQGTVVSSRIEQRCVVPRRSLVGDRLLLVEKSVVRSRLVRVVFHVQGEYPELGVQAEQWAVLADDLPRGTLVIVNAAPSLADGIEVDAVPVNGDGLARGVGVPLPGAGAGR